MPDLDKKLFESHATAGYTEPDWREILAHLIRNLEKYLDQPVQIHQVDYQPYGLVADICCRGTFAGLFRISWFGCIAVSVVGDNEVTVAGATLFLHGAGKRLVAIDGSAYILVAV